MGKILSGIVMGALIILGSVTSVFANPSQLNGGRIDVLQGNEYMHVCEEGQVKYQAYNEGTVRAWCHVTRVTGIFSQEVRIVDKQITTYVCNPRQDTPQNWVESFAVQAIDAKSIKFKCQSRPPAAPAK